VETQSAGAPRVRVTVYTRPFCGYCARALGLLGRKGADIQEIEAGFDPQKRQEMIDRAKATTFPQIFIGEVHVGGCDALIELDRQGKLDALLAS